MGHKHSIYDADPHFEINPITRACKNVSSTKTTIIQYDHDSERFTFQIPRYVEGHDMSLCNVVQVHYINIDSATQQTISGLYEVDDLQISQDDKDVVVFSWLISQNATQLVGSLNFLVRFACVTGGEVDYVWNTAVYSGISVSNGIYNAEVVVEQYVDILEQWRDGIYEPLDDVLDLINGGSVGALKSAAFVISNDKPNAAEHANANSIALSGGALSLGTFTCAGSKGFRITSKTDNGDGTGIYYLDGYTEGFAVGDVYTIRINNYYDRQGTITQIVGNEIQVDNFVGDDLVADPMGDQNTIRVPNKPAIGNVDIGVRAVAVGSNTVADGMCSYAEGTETVATGKNSHAEGKSTVAVYSSHAEGRESKALGQTSHAEGWKTTASGNYSHSEGHTTTASKDNAHAEGWNTVASGESSHAEGNETTASGTRSHAEGYGTKATANFTHAEGKKTTASGESSHAEGDGTVASARATHAEGVNTTASAQMAHAEGYNTKATAEMAHAEGANTTASGKRSHAEGNGSIASGDRAHAEGETTTASGNAAHAEGNNTVASGSASHAGGLYTKAASNYQYVVGKYNVEDTEGKHAFIVGNGTSETARSNAFAVTWDGKLELGGTTFTPDGGAIDKKYELIEEITLDEAVASFSRNMDTDGEAYNFSAFRMRVQAPAAEGANTTTQIIFKVESIDDKNLIYHQVPGGLGTAERVTNMVARNDHGQVDYYAVNSTRTNIGNRAMRDGYIIRPWKNIGSITLSTYPSTVLIPAGTTITIYGIRG